MALLTWALGRAVAAWCSAACGCERAGPGRPAGTSPRLGRACSRASRPRRRPNGCGPSGAAVAPPGSASQTRPQPRLAQPPVLQGDASSSDLSSECLHVLCSTQPQSKAGQPTGHDTEVQRIQACNSNVCVCVCVFKEMMEVWPTGQRLLCFGGG